MDFSGIVKKVSCSLRATWQQTFLRYKRWNVTGKQVIGWGMVATVVLTALVWVFGWIPASVPKLPDQGPTWYYWKLPEPTFWTRLSVWGMYAAHQIAVWGLIWQAQRNKLKYTDRLQPVNYWMLAVNLLFIGLHFVQTYIWYDGLAQDVSIFTSQGSVVLMLVFVLIIENQRRGLFFGKKVGFRKEFTDLIRKNHGYLFSWAIIYTFWYHPMEATSGHLIGFFYTFMLLVQSVLIFNRAHLNRWWTFALEFMVLIHGTMVAVNQGSGLWPIFFFGFFGLVVITQMFGLPISSRARWAIALSYIVGVLGVYGLTDRGFTRLDEVVRIPLIDFGLVFIIYLIFLIGFWTYRGFGWLRRTWGGSDSSGKGALGSGD